MIKKKYLLYVTFVFSEIKVYEVDTDDILHTIGEFYFRSMVTIKHLIYVKIENSQMLEEKKDFWKKNDVLIFKYINKYEIGDL